MKCPQCDGGREHPHHNCETRHGSGRVRKNAPEKQKSCGSDPCFPKRAARDNEKRGVMERVLAVWMRHPHLRLGQLISNANSGHDLFFTQDADLVEKVERYSEERQVAEVQDS